LGGCPAGSRCQQGGDKGWSKILVGPPLSQTLFLKGAAFFVRESAVPTIVNV